MDDVVLDELGGFQQVAQDAGIVRDGNTQGIFNCSHGADSVYGRSNPTDALGIDPGVAGIASRQDQLHPAKHRAGTPRVGNQTVFYLNFDAQMALDTGNGIDGNLLGRSWRGSRRGRLRVAHIGQEYFATLW